jgi:hypothetical protein
MAKKRKTGVNKSEEVRKLLRANPKMKAKEVVADMAKRGLPITDNLVYFIKGKMKGRKRRQKKAQQIVAKVAATGNTDPVAAILKVQALASELGGLKKLKALVEVLS